MTSRPMRSRQPARPAVIGVRSDDAHPRWQVLGLPPDGRLFHDELWLRLEHEARPRRRIFDLRIGLSLLMQGVTRFATVNVKDFQDIGFDSVWNPLV